MSSSCLSSGGGGGRAYRLEALDLDVIKSPSSSCWVSSSSSACESSAISTRKPRTPRKRPNQTYNEAAAILWSAYPKIFPPVKSHHTPFLLEPSDLLMPLQQAHTLRMPLDIKGLTPFEKPCRSPPQISNSSSQCEDEFDAESILDEEIGAGIESIMGNLEMDNQENEASHHAPTFCYGYPVGLGLGLGLESRAMRGADDWWKFPCVNVVDVNPNVGKKKKKVEINKVEETEANAGLLLNLNYNGVVDAWSDKPWPFSDESPASEVRVSC